MNRNTSNLDFYDITYDFVCYKAEKDQDTFSFKLIF